MATTVELSTELDCTLQETWDWVRKPALLDHIAHPLIRFEYEDGFDRSAPWPEGEHRVQIYAFGKAPIGWQVIVIEYADAPAGSFMLRDNGYSPMIKRWDHWIILKPGSSPQATHYTDRVHIEAGLLTPGVAAYAKRFYAHRQKRWRALASSDFAALKA
ncbi:hypothetical protein NAP1_13283 [Erythrobacter sp. NAP1]|uniref:hypothetical protein n=1 Tax=Erythrobacter sp. NAP1 TaxID=237727 RepID=UPI0000687679|nr:hypothetical protein [Erythrobacter sp. NAP1]EAQ28574.1 hypothetical protein NAP1_13283 [Erythrobacter sp. NAP1]